MGRAASDRVRRAALAGAALLGHVLVIALVLWFNARPAKIEAATVVDPLLVTITDAPLPRTVSEGPVPVEVTLAKVVTLEIDAPKQVDVPVDVPVVPAPVESWSPAPSAPVAGQSDSGLNGTDSASGGPAGGGNQLRVLQRVAPQMPMASQANREQGVTLVKARISEAGRVMEARVARSSGYKRLDDAALAAMRKWKFAPAPAGSAPGGFEFEIPFQFVVYPFQYTLLGASTTGYINAEQVKSGTDDKPSPGSQQALARFMAEAGTDSFSQGLDDTARGELAKMRAAMDQWGEVLSIRFMGSQGRNRWQTVARLPASSGKSGNSTVDVNWNQFEVRHRNAVSAWLIAVDDDGMIWNARASRAPGQ